MDVSLQSTVIWVQIPCGFYPDTLIQIWACWCLPWWYRRMPVSFICNPTCSRRMQFNSLNLFGAHIHLSWPNCLMWFILMHLGWTRTDIRLGTSDWLLFRKIPDWCRISDSSVQITCIRIFQHFEEDECVACKPKTHWPS